MTSRRECSPGGRCRRAGRPRRRSSRRGWCRRRRRRPRWPVGSGSAAPRREVDGDRDEADVDRLRGVEAELLQRERGAAEVGASRGGVGDLVEHPHAEAHAGDPAADERPAVEPAGEQAQRDRRQRLQDDDAADELKNYE